MEQEIKNTERRFWDKVDIKGPDECWEWIAAISSKGYGLFRYYGIVLGAHRVAWILTYGEISKGQWVLRKCDNRKCCNPNHLYIGSNGDNMKPMSREDNEKHFWSKVDIKGSEECWPWLGGLDSGGYGYSYFFTNYKPMGAHRVSWTIINGPIPEGKLICHKCDNPICVNPSHLYCGTQKDNMGDRRERFK